MGEMVGAKSCLALLAAWTAHGVRHVKRFLWSVSLSSHISCANMCYCGRQSSLWNTVKFLQCCDFHVWNAYVSRHRVKQDVHLCWRAWLICLWDLMTWFCLYHFKLWLCPSYTLLLLHYYNYYTNNTLLSNTGQSRSCDQLVPLRDCVWSCSCLTCCSSSNCGWVHLRGRMSHHDRVSCINQQVSGITITNSFA